LEGYKKISKYQREIKVTSNWSEGMDLREGKINEDWKMKMKGSIEGGVQKRSERKEYTASPLSIVRR